MKQHVTGLSLSLLLMYGCGPAPVQTPNPTPSATPIPTPTATPFQGTTTLNGQVALDAMAVTVEASSLSGSFRRATSLSNRRYQLENVPVGEVIRLQAQYVNNPNVILSARKTISPEQREKVTTFDVTLESTATDLIFDRAAALNLSAVTALSPEAFEADLRLKPYRDSVLATLQQVMNTSIDVIQVPVPQAPTLVQRLNEVLPLIAATLANQPLPSPSPSASSSPSPGPTPIPTATPAVFTPVRLLVKPGTEITTARNTSIKLWVVGVDAQNRQQTLSPIWAPGSNSGQATLSADGLFTPQSSGSFTYTANYGNLTQSVRINVTNADLDSLELIPDIGSITLDSGRPFELQAKGRDENGNEVMVTPSWELSNSFIGQIDTNGVFTGRQAGRVDITARARGFAATIAVTVESSSSFFLEVTPDRPVVLTGRTQLFQILAQDLATNSSSFVFNFSSLDPSIGGFVQGDTSISGINPAGVFQGLKPGTTELRVRDTLSGATTSIPVTVADGVPYIATMSPANTGIQPGQTVTLTGENFSPVASENEVKFNNIPGSVIAATSSSITATVPVGAFSGYVSIASKGVRGNALPFSITPTLNNIIPPEAEEGQLVTVSGQHFSTDNPAHNVVFFGSARAGVPINVTGTSMQVIVPSNLGDKVDVAVRVKGQISNFREFTLSGANLPNWDERQVSPTARSGASAEIIDGKMYVIGGSQSASSKRLEVYNISNNTWDIEAELPENRTEVTTAKIDDDLYVIGGSGSCSACLHKYDTDTQTWTQLKSMDNGRYGAVAVNYRNEIYVIGGDSSKGRIIERYDPDTDDWETLQASPSRRIYATAQVVNSRIYVIGGGETAEDRVTMYDPDEDEWSTNLAPLPRPVTRASSIVLNNKIYVFGGEDASGNELDSVYEYTPSTNTWRTIKRLPAARSGAAAAALSSRVYVIGGKNSSGTTTNTLFRGTL